MRIILRQSQAGLSLIELIVTLAIISVFTAFVVPNLSTLIAHERTVIFINSLTGALAYARTESIMKQKNIVTCQSNNGSDCHVSADWHNGWIIFTDENNNHERDSNDEVLRIYAANSSGTIAKFDRITSNHYVRYKPSGRAYPNGTFLICNPKMGKGKALVLANTGRLRLSKTQPDGSSITCI